MIRLACMIVLSSLGLATAAEAAAPLAAPPRTISDITAILDQQKPDPAYAADLRRRADEQPDPGLDTRALMSFLFKRGIAAGDIGRALQRRDDMSKCVELGRQANEDFYWCLQEWAASETRLGNGKRATELHQMRLGMIPENMMGRYTSTYATLVSSAATTGNLQAARDYLAQGEAKLKDILTGGGPRSNGSIATMRETWESSLAVARGRLAELEGRYADAERDFRRAVDLNDISLSKVDMIAKLGNGNRSIYENQRQNLLVILAEVLRKQGRLVEAEIEARRALLGALQQRGKYAPETAVTIGQLARILQDQGRAADAERLARVQLDILVNTGNEKGSRQIGVALRQIAVVQGQQGRWAEAMKTWDELRENLAGSPDALEAQLGRNQGYGLALLRIGRAAEAVEVFRKWVAYEVSTVGDKHFDTAEARGLLGSALARTDAFEEARPLLASAAQILLSTSRASDSDDNDPGKTGRQTLILESYIRVLARDGGEAAAAEAFRLADAARGQSVQRALAASSARAAARDPQLAELVRREQDAQKQVAAQFGLLSDVLGRPPEQRDEATVKALRTQIDALRDERGKTRGEIEKRCPAYATLIDPRPATLEQARAALRPGEALIAAYVGQDRSFVWAVPQDGAPAFASVELGEAALARMVAGLRAALDPNATTLEEVPAFDVALAHKLYAALLEPVKAGWQGRQSLLVVAHKSLGQLPFSVLVTAPAAVPAGGAMFAGYRQVPFLARQAAITQVPSVASLATLRALPPAPANRLAFAGFGDPVFDVAAAAPAAPASNLQTRGRPLVRRSAPATEGVSSAELAQLPRLPDTADEVRGVALALHANLDTDVFTGARASEKQVKGMDLSNRRIVMFATHGLVPGDLNGLTQPALALSAPTAADSDGDGLLTMEEILGLRLNADWVVLSACNTASSDGAATEAVSGLGRAFFYAGTRALLVSNWPVETVSARLLTTDLFRRQAEDARLGRAEAVRQAMLALIDGPGYQEDARTVYSYAHPIFWAPFSVVGDGS